jgi:archaellin
MQEYFNQIISSRINPLMENNGYKKNGLSYYKYDNEFLFLINFQKSQGNSSDCVRFYINCGIDYISMEKTFVKSMILEKPKPHNYHFEKRIEYITKKNYQWFEITENTKGELFEKTLLDDISSVLEFYGKIKTEDDFIVLVINSNGLNNYEKIFKYLKIKNMDEYIEKYKRKIYKLLENDERKERFMTKINELIK